MWNSHRSRHGVRDSPRCLQHTRSDLPLRHLRAAICSTAVRWPISLPTGCSSLRISGHHPLVGLIPWRAGSYGPAQHARLPAAADRVVGVQHVTDAHHMSRVDSECRTAMGAVITWAQGFLGADARADSHTVLWW